MLLYLLLATYLQQLPVVSKIKNPFPSAPFNSKLVFSAAVKSTSEHSSLCRGFRFVQEKYLYCATADKV